MNDPHKPLGPVQDDERAIRHAAEQDRIKAAAKLKAAEAKTAGDWFDIFISIVESSVQQVSELSGTPQEQYSATLREQASYNKVVRRKFEEHGLPLTDEIDFEGPDVQSDALGMPHNVTWPRGAWIEFFWPSQGRRGERLRFEGQYALTALAFIQWWIGFNQVGMHMAGKTPIEKPHVVAPGSNEYLDYIEAKKKDQQGS